jgi:predicted aspartyl protease
MTGDIDVKVEVRGKRKRHRTTAKVDTGATMTAINQTTADGAGVQYTGRTVRAKGVSKKPVTLREAEATICLPGNCGCRKMKVVVADDGILNDPVLLGTDYLGPAKAMIDAGRQKIRCRCRGRRR